MMNKLCFLDFEFNATAERYLNLVSVALRCTDGGKLTYQREFWLHDSRKGKAAAGVFFKKIITDGYTFVGYTEAEARSLHSLGIAHGFKYIDLYLEYRCLLNHNHELAYGEQYIKGKIIKTTPPPPKWEQVEGEEDNEAHHKPQYSLASACFKLLGVKVDTVEKNEVRDIIIASCPIDIDLARDRIQRYNLSDIEHLPKLFNAVRNQFNTKGFTDDEWLHGAYSRGDFSERTARMLGLGYPINAEKLAKFQANVASILASSAKECLEVEPDFESFRWAKKEKKFIAHEKKIREWVTKQGKPNWLKTEKGLPSISKKAFEPWYNSESPGFAGAYCRHLKTKQSLNGFMPTNGIRNTFADFVGRDGRVRPFLGIYGAQSARSQPGATGFIPLKAHWMRTFLESPKGKALCGIDYASEEFLIAAIVSQDNAMMEAYGSGDVYLAFAKAAKIVPETATKQSHARLREAAKATVLGISYDMGANGLSPRVAAASGNPCTTEQAQELIDKFYEAYPKYWDWKMSIQKQYREEEHLALPDGWIMWGDNDNRRSVGNFPIQGLGSVIMRAAVKNAQDCGLDVVWTLHDAVYIEFPSDDLSCIEALQTSMADAFNDVMKAYGNTIPIRLEGDAWSADWETKLPDPMRDMTFMFTYSDGKGKKDLQRYEKFFS